MAFLEKLIATDENIQRVAAVCRGEDVVPPLNDHETLMLDAITSPNSLHKLGMVVLGRANITGSTCMGKNVIPTGSVTEDFTNPDGLWLHYVPV